MANEVRSIFYKIQTNLIFHQKELLKLKEIYKKTPFEDFVFEYMQCLESTFIELSEEKNPYVERSLLFASKFATSLLEIQPGVEDDSIIENDTCPFLTRVFHEVFQYHEASVIHVRYRVCQFINLLLKALGDDCYLSDDICNDIQSAMLCRIVDIRSSIRLQAVVALQRLQDPLNPECPIIEAYLHRLADSNAKVRKAVVEVIGMHVTNIPLVVMKCRDVDEHVRVATYEKFSSFPIRTLRISQRFELLTNGFKDRSPIVCKFVRETFLPRWLRYCNNNYFDLLKALSLDADEDDVKQTLALWQNILLVYFKASTVTDIIDVLPLQNKLIPLDELQLENVGFWFNLHKYFVEDSTLNEYVDHILPELYHFASYIVTVYEKFKLVTDLYKKQHYQSIILLLFRMANKYDLSDEMGRRQLHNTIVDMLTETLMDKNSVEEMVKIYSKLYVEEETCVLELWTIISNIREPLVVKPGSQQSNATGNEMKIAVIKVRIISLDIELDAVVKKMDYKLASEIKEKINVLQLEKANLMAEGLNAEERVRETRNDLGTISHCLDILTALFPIYIPQLNKPIPSTMLSIKTDFLEPLLICPDADVLTKVYRCLTVYCLRNKQIAIDTFGLFVGHLMQYKKNSSELILLTVMKSLTDLLRWYGPEVLQIPTNDTNNVTMNTTSKRSGKRQLYDATHSEIMEESLALPDPTFENIIRVFIEMLNDDSQAIRIEAGFDLSSLIVTKRCKSPTLLSQIILKWVSPATEVTLRAYLGEALNCIIMDQSKNQWSICEEAVIPVLTVIANAPKTSPLADVDIDTLLKFLSEFAHGSRSNANLDAHKNIANSLCCKIYNNPLTKCLPLYCRFLLYLDPPGDDQTALNDLIKQMETANKLISDRSLQKYVEKYLKNLRSKILNGTNVSNRQITTIEEEIGSEELEKNTIEETAAKSNGLQLKPVVVLQRINIEELQKVMHSVETPSVRSNESENSLTNNKSTKRRKNRRTNDDLSQDSTILHTIIHKTAEVEMLDISNLTIETPTSPSTTNSNSEIIASTTDYSDTEASVKKPHKRRKYRRNHKK